MDQPSLVECRFQLAEAKKHLHTLEGLIKDYLFGGPPNQWGNRSPYDTGTRVEPDEDGTFWRVTRFRNVRPVPPELGYAAGQAVRDMRSALDHWVCQLALLNRKEPTRRTAFPIFTEEPTGPRLATYNAMLARVSKHHRAFIGALQPYRAPAAKESRLLAALAALDNQRKHRKFNPLLLSVDPDRQTPARMITVRPNPEFQLSFGEVKEGAEHMRYRANTRGEYMYVEGEVKLTLAFGERPGAEFRDLFEIHSYVVGIIEAAASVFP